MARTTPGPLRGPPDHATGTGPDGGEDALVLGVGGDEEDGSVDPAHRRERAAGGEIDEDHVGAKARGRRDGLRRGVGLPDELDVARRTEQGADAGAEHGMLVGEQHADPLGAAPRVGRKVDEPGPRRLVDGAAA
jgi:hypothetical protein